MFDLALLVAVIVGLTEVLKRVVRVPNRFLPLIALVLGVISSLLYVDGMLQDKILIGIVLGLSASGLFDHSKIIKE